MRALGSRSALCVLAVMALIASTIGGDAIQGELVITKDGTNFYHWPGCPVVQNADGVLAMTRGQAELRGLKPHPACDPSKAPPAASPGSPGARTSKPAGPVYVFVDAAGRHYHRAGCAKLGNDPKKIVLDADAAKKYWPCTVCRPPIRKRKG